MNAIRSIPGCCILISVILTLQANARYHNYYFEHITSKNGLTNSRVNRIIKDNKGYIWFATGNGLSRYNAYETKVFIHNDYDSTSISANYVRNIFMDKNGTIWAGTINGLSRFDHELECFTNYFPGIYIKHISELRNGYLSLSTNQGIFFFHPETQEIKKITYQENSSFSLSGNTTFCTLEAPNGEIWIGTLNGLDCYNPEKQEIRHFTHIPKKKNTLSSNTILTLFLDSKENIWVGNFSGVDKLNPKTKEITRLSAMDYPFSGKRVFCFGEDIMGHIWIAGYSGLYRFSPEKHTTKSYTHVHGDFTSLSSNRLRCVFPDGNLVWTGHYETGVSVLNLLARPFWHLHFPKESNTANNNIYPVTEDSNGNLWIGTHGAGVYRYNKNNNQLQSIDEIIGKEAPFKNDYISSIKVDVNGILWIGTEWGGLVSFNPKTYKFKIYKHKAGDKNSLTNDFVTCIEIDSANKLWVGTFMGFNYFSPETSRFETYTHNPENSNSLVNNDISVVFKDSKGNLWIGSWKNGLSKFNSEDKTFRNFYHEARNPATLPGKRISCIYEDQDGVLWFGTENGFCRLLSDNRSFESFNVQNGLPGNKVCAILGDNMGKLWITTNNGLCSFDINTQKIITFNERDGLQKNEFNLNSGFKNKNGVLHFGGLNGITTFSPSEVEINTKPPPVVFTNFLLFNKAVNIKPTVGKRKLKTNIHETILNGTTSYSMPQHISAIGEITLNYTHSIFGIEFSALNYIKPELNTFKYQLEGFDKNWNETNHKHRRITYTNVPPGSYIMHVKASNNSGYWNERGISLKIKILPPWWLTWWAKALWSILLISILAALYVIRVSVLQNQKKMLEHEVEKQTKEVVRQKEEIETQARKLKSTNQRLIELDDFRQGLTDMIVHDLKNPLNYIINATETHLQAYQKKVKQSGKIMLNMVLNILDVNKYENTTMPIRTSIENAYLLSQNAINEVIFLADRKNIRIINNIEHNSDIRADKYLIDRVLVNLLTNAIKYTPNNGKVELSARNDNETNELVLSVKDSGLGIPAKQLPRIFDRFVQMTAKDSGNIRSTGLGLTFCKMAIEAHGSKINVDSMLNEGTNFWFALKKGSPGSQPLSTQKKAHQTNISVKLSASDKTRIKPHINSFNKLLVYETSAIEKLLDLIETENSDALESWKKEIRECLFSMNEEKYEDLIKLVSC